MITKSNGETKMADKIYENVFGPDGKSGKVADNITREAVDAGKKLVSDMVKKFEDIGFRPNEVAPLIRKGVKEGIEK
jgi:hypothetical protein